MSEMSTSLFSLKLSNPLKSKLGENHDEITLFFESLPDLKGILLSGIIGGIITFPFTNFEGENHIKGLVVSRGENSLTVKLLLRGDFTPYELPIGTEIPLLITLPKFNP